jgi:hypothetical protein
VTVLDSKVKVEAVLSSVCCIYTNTDLNCTINYDLYVVYALLARIEMQGGAYLCYLYFLFFWHSDWKVLFSKVAVENLFYLQNTYT